MCFWWGEKRTVLSSCYVKEREELRWDKISKISPHQQIIKKKKRSRRTDEIKKIHDFKGLFQAMPGYYITSVMSGSPLSCSHGQLCHMVPLNSVVMGKHFILSLKPAFWNPNWDCKVTVFPSPDPSSIYTHRAEQRCTETFKKACMHSTPDKYTSSLGQIFGWLSSQEHDRTSGHRYMHCPHLQWQFVDDSDNFKKNVSCLYSAY